MKILICSYAYPPISSPGAMRVYYFAKGLAELGHTVTVLTTLDGYSSMLSQDSYDEESIKIIRVPDFMSTHKFKGGAVKAAKDSSLKPSIKSFLAKVASSMFVPDRDITWLPSALFTRKLLGQDFEIVIGSYPYATNLILAALLSKRKRAKLVVDMRDLWVDSIDSSTKKGGLHSVINNALQKFVMKAASGIISVSEVNAAFLEKSISHLRYPPKLCVIRNGFDYRKISSIRQAVDTTCVLKDKFKMAYAGSFYNGERDPTNIFQVIRTLKDKGVISEENFEFSIYGKPEEIIQACVSQYAIGDLVHFEGLLGQNELFSRTASADMLVVVTRRSSISAGEMTTKLYEYIGLGPDILCLCEPGYEVENVLGSVQGADVVYFDDLDHLENHISSKIRCRSASEQIIKRPLSRNFSRQQASEQLSCYLTSL